MRTHRASRVASGTGKPGYSTDIARSTDGAQPGWVELTGSDGGPGDAIQVDEAFLL